MSAYLKAYAALVGSIATALLAVYTADTEVGKLLTVVAVIATAVGTWAIPNLDPKAQHQDESVQPPVRTERGDVPVVTAILVVLLVVVVLVFLVPAIR